MRNNHRHGRESGHCKTSNEKSENIFFHEDCRLPIPMSSARLARSVADLGGVHQVQLLGEGIAVERVAELPGVDPALAGPGLEGPVPPFGFLDISATARDRPGLCASLEVTGASSASGGDLSSFPGGATSPGSYGRFFLFAFRPGEYHLTVRAKPFRQPCDAGLTLENPNNQWTKTAPITGAQQSIEFDFNILSTDLNSDLWNNG